MKLIVSGLIGVEFIQHIFENVQHFLPFSFKFSGCFLRPEPYIALLAALVLFLPVIIWNAENQWASFNFQGARRVQGEFEFS